MTPQELKNSILQLAIQGKLVEQRPEEGTGEELYRQIQRERQALVKAGKLKKQKPLPEITEDEVPFEVPEGWKWTYIGEVFLHNTGKAQNSSGSLAGKMRKYITTSNLYWNRFDFSRVKEMPFTDAEIERCSAQKGDLLVCEGGDCGRAAIWTFDEDVCIQNHIHRLRPFSQISIEYYYYVIYLFKFTNRLNGRGVGIKGLSSDAIHKVIIPLPPLAEQRRIVAKIEALLPLVDRYAQAWTRLEDFNRRFPADLRKSILQMAIQGKLVEQRPEEGTGEELYRQIQREKRELVKAGKLKKQKALPEVGEDEVPFEVPETWKWVHLNSIAESGLGKTLDKAKNTGNMYPYLCSINVYWSGISLDKIKQAKFTEEERMKYRLCKGDMLICEGGDVGRTAIWESEQEMYYQNALHRVRFYCGIEPYYFKYVIECYKYSGIIEQYSKGMTIKHLVQNSLYAMWLPLPPLAEQRRIVAKVEELMAVCEGLK